MANVAIETTVPKQEKKGPKPQPSRKGKKAWRKNVDMTEVEEGLEASRTDERVRGASAANLADSELFTIDTTGDATVRKQLAREKQLTADIILAQRSAVPAIRAKALEHQKKESKHDKQKIEQLAKRKLEGGSIDIPQKKAKATNQKYDLWGEAPAQEEVSDFLEHTKKREIKAPPSMQKKPVAAQHQPAVIVPHPGASYNPSLEEYQKLVEQASEIEQKKAELQKQIDEYLSYREELDNLKGELDDVESEEEAIDPENIEALEKLKASRKKKEGVRKTRAQRNKQKRLRGERAERSKREQLRKLRRQIDEWTEIEKGIRERMQVLQEQNELRQKHKEEAEKEGKKRLGKHKIQEMPLDVQLPEDLSDTLRQLKPEGDILRERYVSFQKRNIIEPRVPVKRERKYKLKMYEKRSHKNFDLEEARKAKAKAAVNGSV